MVLVAVVTVATFLVEPAYRNEPLKAWDPETGYRHTFAQDQYVEGSDDMLFAIAFSGGGTRAAAFGYGVLEELRDTEIVIDGQPRRLLDEVDFVTGVSGGSFTAAYFSLFGDRIFEDFEERFLKRNVQRELILKMANPTNWIRLLSARFNRTDLAAGLYDEEIFDGATFGDIEKGGGPKVVINATDLATGNPFHFVQDQFDLICSDLTNFPVASAVAASAAVPVPFPPLVLRNYGGTCGYEMPKWLQQSLESRRTSSVRKWVNARILASYLDSSVRRYIHLVDGGISDNLAVRNPLSDARATDAERDHEDFGIDKPLLEGNIRRIVLIIVNAQTEAEVSWGLVDGAPSVPGVLAAITNTQIDRYSVETLELLLSKVRLWERRAAEVGSHLDLYLVEVSFLTVPDAEEREYLNRIPTTLHLEPEDVDRLRESARRLLRQSAEFQKLRLELSKPVNVSNP